MAIGGAVQHRKKEQTALETKQLTDINQKR
jgi:hypothetical protein